MTKSPTSPLARLVKRLVLPAPPAPAPQPEQPEGEQDQEPTVKMYQFIKYGD